MLLLTKVLNKYSVIRFCPIKSPDLKLSCKTYWYIRIVNSQSSTSTSCSIINMPSTLHHSYDLNFKLKILAEAEAVNNNHEIAGKHESRFSPSPNFYINTWRLNQINHSFIHSFIHSFFICHYIQHCTMQDGNNMGLKKSKWRGDLKETTRLIMSQVSST